MGSFMWSRSLLVSLTTHLPNYSSNPIFLAVYKIRYIPVFIGGPPLSRGSVSILSSRDFDDLIYKIRKDLGQQIPDDIPISAKLLRSNKEPADDAKLCRIWRTYPDESDGVQVIMRAGESISNTT